MLDLLHSELSQLTVRLDNFSEKRHEGLWAQAATADRGF